MAKPRIIVLMHYMELGGAEMALLGLLSALDPGRVDVDLFVYDHRGPLMQHIPEHVNLLPEIPAYSVIERPIVEAVRRGQFGVATGRLIAKWKHHFYIKNKSDVGEDASIYSFLGHHIISYLPRINSHVKYDLCISFLMPHDIAIAKVTAKKYMAWLHTDYSMMSINDKMELNVWTKYNYIASISDSVGNAFVNVFPSLKSKIINIENILPKQYIINQSDIRIDDNITYGFPKLLSIGRYVYAKNYDNLPYIALELVNCGYKDLRWYIIGYGDDSLIRQSIIDAGMEEHVILMGKRDNPYPYIKACDIYVQPSRYEGKSITVREAQMLGKPVVVTAYPTAPSQIDDGVDGIIVPLDNAGCARGLASIISDEKLQQNIREYLLSRDLSGNSDVSKIYKIIEEQ